MSAQPDASPLPEALAALPGGVVTRLVIDDSLTLVLTGPGLEAAVRVDGAGRLEQDGKSHAFSPDADPESLWPVLVLLHKRVRRAGVAADGALELEFEGGERLISLPEDHNVAWQVQLAGGSSVSCIAEGKVVWR